VFPVLNAVQRKAQRLVALAGDRIVEADTLDEATVAPVARVGDDDVEEGALLCAATGKTDDDNGLILVARRKDSDYMTKTTDIATGRGPQP
jgi:hypothetical protein